MSDAPDWIPSSLTGHDSALTTSALGASSTMGLDHGASFAERALPERGEPVPGVSGREVPERPGTGARTSLSLDSVTTASANGPIAARLVQEYADRLAAARRQAGPDPGPVGD